MPLNAFGEDLKKAGFRWTEALCRMDSDGDGRTNGEELGDPCCSWSVEAPGQVEDWPWENRGFLRFPGTGPSLGTRPLPTPRTEADRQTEDADGADGAEGSHVRSATLRCPPDA